MEYAWLQRHDPPPRISIDAPFESQPSGKFCEGSPPIADHSLFSIEGNSEAGFIGLMKRLRLTTFISVVCAAVASLCEAKAEDVGARPPLIDLGETRKKVEQGDANAQFSLREPYAFGIGVAKDPVESVKWYRLAAEQGHVRAQGMLGLAYFQGEGVPRDAVEAHAWWNVAAARGDGDAKKALALVEELMTREQVAEATTLARERFEKFGPKAR